MPEQKVRDKVDAAIDALPIERLRAYVNYVAEILYYDHDAKRWNLDKEFDGDTLDKVEELFPTEIRAAVDAETPED